MKTVRGYTALRRFRVSIPQARYFLTLCTRDRVAGLTQEDIAPALRDEMLQIAANGGWTLLAAVVMPDHFHLLIELGDGLPLSRLVARFKTCTKPVLQTKQLAWQGNFYEHRLRPADAIEAVVRYVHLNPYRAGLVVAHEEWPWFWLGGDVKHWFVPETDDGKPFPEWVVD